MCVALFRTVCIFVTNVGARLCSMLRLCYKILAKKNHTTFFFKLFFNHFSSVRVRLCVSVSAIEQCYECVCVWVRAGKRAPGEYLMQALWSGGSYANRCCLFGGKRGQDFSSSNRRTPVRSLVYAVCALCTRLGEPLAPSNRRTKSFSKQSN